MTDQIQLKKNMIVRIDPICELSKKFYEFHNPKKLELLGRMKKIQEIKQVGYSPDRFRINIENWFFDSRDLTPISTEEDLLVHIDQSELEKNKAEKTKIYFNPEQL